MFLLLFSDASKKASVDIADNSLSPEDKSIYPQRQQQQTKSDTQKLQVRKRKVFALEDDDDDVEMISTNLMPRTSKFF